VQNVNWLSLLTKLFQY